MKRTKKITSNNTSDRSREDIDRIHTMLRVAIAHIEKKTQNIAGSSPSEEKEEALDEMLTGLTKITALISKLIPIEKEIEGESGATQDDTILEDAIDWDMLERYFRKKSVAKP